MNCSQVREILYPSPDRAVITIETAEAMAHLRGCNACREHFESDAEWTSILRQKLGTETVPAPLLSRIAKLVQSRQRSRPPWRIAPVATRAAAAAAITLCIWAAWWAYRWPSQRFFEEVFEDHARYLNAQSQLPSADPATIESWFRDRAEVDVRIPRLDSADLLGGRLCFLKQHRAALIFYRKQGRPVSLFQLSASGVSLTALNRLVIDGNPVWHKSSNGFGLVAFESRGVITVLVSDLGEGELLPLALAARRG